MPCVKRSDDRFLFSIDAAVINCPQINVDFCQLSRSGHYLIATMADLDDFFAKKDKKKSKKKFTTSDELTKKLDEKPVKKKERLVDQSEKDEAQVSRDFRLIAISAIAEAAANVLDQATHHYHN